MINKNFQIFFSNFGHSEGRGKTAPIFWQKLEFGIFSKFFQHRLIINKILRIVFSDVGSPFFWQ